ncbi:MAG: hypothetical protein ABII90_04580 [Bacteroidota bacterium]
MGVDDSDDDKFKIGTSAISTTPRMTIDGSGYVGIGTEDPGTQLEVNSGGADVAPIFAISTPSAADFVSIFGGRNSNQLPFIAWRRGSFRFATATTFGGGTFSEKMRITESGDVGIGTASPSYQLQLSQNSAAKPGSDLWTIASDITLKQDTSLFTDGLSLLKQFRPIRFRYNGLGYLPTD